MNNRRRNLLLMAGAIMVAPHGVLAQPEKRIWKVGFLSFGSRAVAQETGRLAAFLQEMKRLGYTPGQNFILEERYADGELNLVPGIVGELVRQKPDVIVASGGQTYRPLRNATSTIPIVITVTVDPISAGYAATLSRPGGNLTGLVDTASDLGPKHLELLLATVPRVNRIAVLANPTNPTHPAQFMRMTASVQETGKQIYLIEAQNQKEIEAGFAVIGRAKVDALISFGDTVFTDQLKHIADLSLKHRIPSIHGNPRFADAGGLLAYGHDLVENFRRAAVYVDKILKGVSPGELPFEQPTNYQLLINLKTAKLLGIAVPQALRLRASKVIE